MRHKVKLRRKPLSKWLFVAPLLIAVASVVFLYAVLKASDIFNININISPFILLLLITFDIICIVTSYLISSFNIFSKTKRKLREVIFVNNFYSMNEKTNEIVQSAMFIYCYKNDKLFIEFHPNGLKCANKMNELQPILETALKMFVEEINDSKPNFTTYVLSKNNGGNRIDVSQKWNWTVYTAGQRKALVLASWPNGPGEWSTVEWQNFFSLLSNALCSRNWSWHLHFRPQAERFIITSLLLPR